MTLMLVSTGLGVNSLAVLIGLRNRGLRPTLIVFSDTGGEKPETYDYIHVLSPWLLANGFPPLSIVKNERIAWKTLEQECLAEHTLPSKVFGRASCSDKWKHRPFKHFVERDVEVQASWASGKPVTRVIGIDADEAHRAGASEAPTLYTNWFPLIEWNMGREDCVDLIQREGLPVPPKSACFFCPSSTKREVTWLRDTHPALFARALTMEQHASGLLQIKGLGRSWSWGSFSERDLDPPDATCICVAS